MNLLIICTDQVQLLLSIQTMLCANRQTLYFKVVCAFIRSARFFLVWFLFLWLGIHHAELFVSICLHLYGSPEKIVFNSAGWTIECFHPFLSNQINERLWSSLGEWNEAIWSHLPAAPLPTVACWASIHGLQPVGCCLGKDLSSLRFFVCCTEFTMGCINGHILCGFCIKILKNRESIHNWTPL